MARALAPVARLSVIVNVGDDETIYGLDVSPDLDSVTYTLAGLEGPEGWGRREDTFHAMATLAMLGIDTTFRLGDRDLGLNLLRTQRRAAGDVLSAITGDIVKQLNIPAAILPATDQRLPTRVTTAELGRLSFQEYFVKHQAAPTVTGLEFVGADAADAAPGVVEAIAEADVVVIAPSNPPLSIWPILAIEPIRAAVAGAGTVLAVSPLVGGAPVKGPTDRVMASLGYEVSHAGVADCYADLLTHLVVDADPPHGPFETLVRDTMLDTPARSADFGSWFVGFWT